MTRPRRALLALVLALPAALGLALVVAGLTRLVDGDAGPGIGLGAVGTLLVAGAVRMLRRVNARAASG